MTAVAVLCGGKGTRLGQPIKCLTEVAGRRFMDWKVEQLYRCGVHPGQITLICGPFRDAFEARYGPEMRYMSDPQTGIRDALGDWQGWWTWGDTLLEQPLDTPGCYVTPGTHIAGLWLDAGLYHGPGPWTMVETPATPYHINTPADLEVTSAYLHRLSQSA